MQISVIKAIESSTFADLRLHKHKRLASASHSDNRQLIAAKAALDKIHVKNVIVTGSDQIVTKKQKVVQNHKRHI